MGCVGSSPKEGKSKPVDRYRPAYKVQRRKDFHALYDVGEELGRGQYGTVLHCTRKSDGRRLAVKRVEKSIRARRARLFAHLKSEVRVMHHLSGDPSVVEMVDTYEDDSCLYIVMELCTGGDLFDQILAQGFYSERKAADLFVSILRVLQHCQNLGVMHRDLKPENFIFSAPNGVLKSLDFGLAAFFKPGEYKTDIVGSPFYMAPEVIEGRYGPECDLWSAGVILYILLCGSPPFRGILPNRWFVY